MVLRRIGFESESEEDMKDDNRLLTFGLNGKKVTVLNPDPALLLADYLHEHNRTGTRVACGEGGCGSCTVMLSWRDETSPFKHLAINACLRPLCSIAGMHVTTIEGIGSLRDGLDPVQYRIAANNGSQCGFCTPGFVMNMYSFLQNKPQDKPQDKPWPTQQEIENLFDGNLCRCTGYRAILHGMKTFASDYVKTNGTPACGVDPAFPPGKPLKKELHFPVLPTPGSFQSSAPIPGATSANDLFRWYRPRTLEEVFERIKEVYAGNPSYTAYPKYDIHKVMLVVGHTSIGVCDSRAHVFIDVSQLSELTGFGRVNSGGILTVPVPGREPKKVKLGPGIQVGASVSIQRFLDFLDTQITTPAVAHDDQITKPPVTRDEPPLQTPQPQPSGLAAFRDLAGQIGSLQIRNTGSLAGNIFLAKSFEHFYAARPEWHPTIHDTFVSDLVTALATLDAAVTIHNVSLDETAESKPWEAQDKSPKKTSGTTYPILETPPLVSERNDQFPVFLHFFIPDGKPGEIVRTYKVARRSQNGQAIVNAGFRVRFGEGKVKEIRIVYGGLGYNSIAAVDTENFLLGKTASGKAGRTWSRKTLAGALETLHKELEKRTVELPGGAGTLDLTTDVDYRISLAKALFYRFFLDVALEPDSDADEAADPSETKPLQRPLSSGSQKDFRLLSAANRSGARPLERPLSSGRQKFSAYPAEYPAGKPLVKMDAFMQATGEVKYTHDIPLPAGGLHSMVVGSRWAAASFYFRISKTQSEPVRLSLLKDYLRDKFDGFVDFITYVDIPKKGKVGIGPANDDPVFVPYKYGGNPAEPEAGLQASFNTVTCVGAPIGLVVAETVATALATARYIEAECIGHAILSEYIYEGETVPRVIKLEDAVEQCICLPQQPGGKLIPSTCFWQKPKTKNHPRLTSIRVIDRPTDDKDWWHRKNFPGAVPAGTVVLEEKDEVNPEKERRRFSFKTGSQAQFYLETMAAVAIPAEEDQMTIYVSTQNPAGDQATVARVLGLKANSVDVIVKRIGGGFGGKQTRSAFVSGAVAVAAWKLQRPVKLVLPRRTDLTMVGKRHPFEGEYRIAYRSDGTGHDGQIEAWATAFNSDGGNTYDVSFPVMDLAQLLSDNVYNVGKFRNVGQVYRTNKASNTAMRSFGTMQAILIQETAIEHVACKLGILPEEVRARNFYPSIPDATGKTPYGQELRDCNIADIWRRLWKSSEFEERERAINGSKGFNAKNRWKKRGLSMIPLKYGVSYTGPRGAFNQGYALVNAYSSDGSVLVLCGGIEMGQGLNTKMAQIAARTLGVPLASVKVGRVDTDSVPNSTTTGASTGSDLNGGAVEIACRKLRSRLEQFCSDLEEFNRKQAIGHWWIDSVWQKEWPKIVQEAYKYRVNLSAQGHYKTPHYSAVDAEHPTGHPFHYFTYSAAASEVEIDVLTGQFMIRRSDILYDVGRSLNPCIDVGQIEGAFVQGIGYVTTEEVIHDAGGRLVTDRTWNYKPPFCKDIPVDFRVDIMPSNKLSPADSAVMSSKGIGEPPLVLASSVFFAIRHAIAAARKDQGNEGWFEMDAPATVQRIKEKCGVEI